MPEDIARMMVERNVASMPTLAMYHDYYGFVLEPELLDYPLARALATPELIADYRSEAMIEYFRQRQTELETDFHNVSTSVKLMADAGVAMLLGTDSGMAGTLQGYSVHRELTVMVEAGMTPWQALAAATTNAGDFLGRNFGVTPGSEANLLVLDASPIEDISNTQSIAAVIHRGNIVDRDSLLESEAAGLRH
jgi:imidazolonepropionase-like amidohydrolase